MTICTCLLSSYSPTGSGFLTLWCGCHNLLCAREDQRSTSLSTCNIGGAKQVSQSLHFLSIHVYKDHKVHTHPWHYIELSLIINIVGWTMNILAILHLHSERQENVLHNSIVRYIIQNACLMLCFYKKSIS